jgi:hypothetical protein
VTRPGKVVNAIEAIALAVPEKPVEQAIGSETNTLVAKKSAKQRGEKSAKPAKQSVPDSAPSLTEQEDARELLRKLVAAIERTHGYLSKTILAQFFSGLDNRAIQGLRLQRLPEFGLLASWKKSHVSSFLDLLLDRSILLLTELRAGKVTVSVSPSGLELLNGIGVWPEDIVHQCARYQSQSATASADSQAAPLSNKTVDTPMEIAPPPELPESSTQVVDESPTKTESSQLGDCDLQDALQVRDPMVGTFQDWQWTLRMAKHGYRLGEIALIRGKQPDQILVDLCDAMDVGEIVPIDQLFDKRTQIAIREIDSQSQTPPLAFASFPRLWDFAKRWKSM